MKNNDDRFVDKEKKLEAAMKTLKTSPKRQDANEFTINMADQIIDEEVHCTGARNEGSRST